MSSITSYSTGDRSKHKQHFCERRFVRAKEVAEKKSLSFDFDISILDLA
jgi:hypothetical protein